MGKRLNRHTFVILTTVLLAASIGCDKKESATSAAPAGQSVPSSSAPTTSAASSDPASPAPSPGSAQALLNEAIQTMETERKKHWFIDPDLDLVHVYWLHRWDADTTTSSSV